MPIDVLFIHSAGPQIGEQGSAPFVKHLRQKLGSDYNVRFPLMPAPSKPSYRRWKLELEKLLPNNKPAQILIGHSLGGSVLLKYLSEQTQKISAMGLFLVASPYWGIGDWKAEEFVLPKDFKRSLPERLNIYLYQSEDDEVVSIDHLNYYANAIPTAKVRKLNGGGHTFKNGLLELVEDIRKLNVN